MHRILVPASVALLAALAPLSLCAEEKEEESFIVKKIRQVGENAKLERVKADFSTLSSCLKMYKLNAGHFPTHEQGLQSLVDKPAAAPLPRRWTRLLDKVPLDSWDRPYRYLVREKDGKREYVVASDGPDKADPKDDMESVVDAEVLEKK
jgi:general secretion pathway protein G